MLHLAVSGLQKSVREIPRTIRYARKTYGERRGHQLGSGIREADAEIQSGDHFIRSGFSYDPDHLVIHGSVRFFSIAALGRVIVKNVAGRG